jgi:hypothetical protein
MGNFNQMQFTGDDFFKNKDVCSIVLELPNSELRSNEVGIWACTVEKTGEGWIQADRGARPLLKKAYTSRAFEIETIDLAKHSQSGGQFFGIHASNDGKIMMLGRHPAEAHVG